MTLRPFRRMQAAPVDEDVAELNARRLEAARRMPFWTEVAPPVRRGPLLVDADTDAVYLPHRGAVFARGEVRPSFHEQLPLTFYADAEGAPRFLAPAGSRTWSEVVARKARRR